MRVTEIRDMDGNLLMYREVAVGGDVAGLALSAATADLEAANHAVLRGGEEGRLATAELPRLACAVEAAFRIDVVESGALEAAAGGVSAAG